MLTLTRKHGESIIIDGVIRVVVMIDGNKVRLGIDAPKEVTVHREEVVRRMVAESQDLPSDVSGASQDAAPLE